MDITLVISRSADRDEQRRAFEDSLVRAGEAAGLRVILAPHLYHLPNPSPVWDELRNLPGDVRFASWLYPRPFEWLLRRQGIPVDPARVFHLSAGAPVEGLLGAIGSGRTKDGANVPPPREIFETVNARWYPVIDGARCVNCQHCLQFCLFSVYETDEQGRVIVRNPDHCKPGCPACSRICPEGAIMFPLYDRDEAIAGAPGRFMAPDAAARKMFYARTERVCPVCGTGGNHPANGSRAFSAATCPECGRSRGTPGASSGAPDDIDVLIDRLEKLSRKNR